MTDSGKAVFLSYASQDAETAQRLCNALRAVGIEVWFDQNELRGGDAWDASIRRQIKSCALFIPVISRNTHARDEGYFRLEWKLAVDRSHLIAADRPFLVPVVVDDTPEQDERVPDRFREVQWTRLPAGANTDAFVEHVHRLLSPDAAPHSAPTLRPMAPPISATGNSSHRSTPSTLRSFVPWIVGAALLLATGYLVTDKFVASKRASLSAETLATPPAHVQADGDKSIAVLPFADMSEKHDQEYFGDGMAEEILDLLTKIPGLTVIGRTSSFQFKGKSEDLRTIGARIGARYVVEGSVRKAGARIRVTAQLIDSRSGAHRWSESYDRDFGDILALQDEIATGIARALQISVDAGEGASSHHTLNPEAYTLYLRGRLALDQVHLPQLSEAVRDFEQALSLEPSFLHAAEALALAHVAQGFDEDMMSREAWHHAREAAERALRIDPNSAPAHGVLGFVHAVDEFDWIAAQSEFDKALTLNPRDPIALYYAGIVASARGQVPEAQRLFSASLSIDPLNPSALQNFGQMLFASGDFAGAEATFRKSIAISAMYDGNHYFLCRILLADGQIEAAQKEVQAEPAPDAKDAGLAMVYYTLHRKAASDAALNRLIQASGDTWPYSVATVYAYRGEHSEAMEWLEKARETRDSDLLAGIRGDPEFGPLHADPRYKAFLRKMNLPE